MPLLLHGSFVITGAIDATMLWLNSFMQASTKSPPESVMEMHLLKPRLERLHLVLPGNWGEFRQMPQEQLEAYSRYFKVNALPVQGQH